MYSYAGWFRGVDRHAKGFILINFIEKRCKFSGILRSISDIKHPGPVSI